MCIKINQIPNNNSNQAKWYILNTFSGHENKVKNAITRIIENNNLQNSIVEIKIPTEKTVKEYANGKKRTVEKNLFPGYVFIKMNYNNELGYLLTNISGVVCFCGPKGNATPMTEDEIRRMGIDSDIQTENFVAGDKVSIVSGPLKGFSGDVKDANNSIQKAIVKVSMFNHIIETEAEYFQLKKVG